MKNTVVSWLTDNIVVNIAVNKISRSRPRADKCIVSPFRFTRRFAEFMQWMTFANRMMIERARVS